MHQQKDFSNITSLEVNEQCVTTPLDNAETLNDQFFTFFTDENSLFPNFSANWGS